MNNVAAYNDKSLRQRLYSEKKDNLELIHIE